ncbi:MAG: DUF3617 domain-containing protein [Gammaproteobacteria bacterium]
MKIKTSLIVIALATAPIPTLAASAADMSKAIDPGLWETTVHMQMTGMSVPPQTTRSCKTQADLNKYHGLPKLDNDKGMTCKMTHFSYSGHVAHFGVKCSGTEGNMETTGSSTIDSRTAYHGTMTMNGTIQGHAMKMTTNYTAKRVGACKSSAPKNGG